MHQGKSWLVSSIFIIIDIIASFFIFQFSLLIRNVLTPILERPPVMWMDVILVAELGILFIIVILLLEGLYPGYGLTAIKELERMVKAITMAFILLAMVSYLNKPFQVFPRSIIVIAWAQCIVLLPIFRFLTRNLLSRTRLYGVPVLIFGEGEWAQNVVYSLKRVRRLGWRPCGVLSLNDLKDRNKFGNSSIAILASTPDDTLEEQVRFLNQYFQRIILIQKAENLGSLWVETRDMDSYLGLEFHFHLLDKRNIWFKRAVDIISATILLFLLSPLLLLLIILVALESPGPIFFRQERLGKDFKKFYVIKFRTMINGAEDKLYEMLEKDPVMLAEYQQFHKLEKDPRVTRFGYFLRKFSLDELPQFWNVLKGEMSLSGPRAYMPSELKDMGSYAAMIFRVRPGITGWWQVLGRHQTTFTKRLQMDEYYISNWSLWMDAYITMRTILVILTGKGA
jgi:Undecaprenyl-phosphate galactose phosphotransferase WbaP